MTETNDQGGLHIDSDWKTEAAQEKERLAAQEQKEAAAKPAAAAGTGTGGEPPIGIVDLINMLAMQAAIGLGGYQGPGGERIPANPPAAKHNIDLLEVVQEKTKGNLSADEEKVLGAVLYELRMNFVQATSATPPPAAPAAPAAPSE